MSPSGLAGAVLAGGASRRMGRDKAAIEVHGRSMAAIALDALAAAGVEELFVVGGLSGHGVRLVADTHPGEGPLGGVLDALAAGAGRAVVTLPCDVPWITAEEVMLLTASRHDQDLDVTLGAVSGRPSPPIGLWRPSARDVLETAFAGGERSFRGLMGRLRCEVVELGERGRDVDRPAELPSAGSLPTANEETDRAAEGRGNPRGIE